MKHIYCHIKNAKGKVVYSDLPYGTKPYDNLKYNQIENILCPISNKPIKHVLFEGDNSIIYLVSYEKSITNKIFKRYIEACLFFIKKFEDAQKHITDKENQNFRRLKHNLITHNTNILQELEKLFPPNTTPKGGHKQIDYIKNIINKNQNESALLLLKIIKSANFMKSDFDVYDMLNSKNPFIEFDPHNIHRITFQVLHPFWLDFIQKGVQVEITDCQEKVKIDYKSFSVVLSHLFDNFTKYTAPNSNLSIKFIAEINLVSIVFEMTSLKITDEDNNLLFEENFSGEYAKKLGKSGDGIGLNVVKRLINLNNGEIEIERNIDETLKEKILGIPYERNKFIIKLRK